MELKMYTDYYSNQLKNCRRLVSSASIGLRNGILGRYKPPPKKSCPVTKESSDTETDENSTTDVKETKDTDGTGETQANDTEEEEEICDECNQIIPDLCDKCNQYIIELNDDIKTCGSCEQELKGAINMNGSSGKFLKDGSFCPNCDVCKRSFMSCPKCDQQFEFDEDYPDSEKEDDGRSGSKHQGKQSGNGKKKDEGPYSHLKSNF